MRFSLALLLTILVSASPALAAYCSEPSEPYCLDILDDASDRSDIESCRWEVESFVSDSQEYVRCLKQAADEAVEKSNDSITKYNCRARRESFC